MPCTVYGESTGGNPKFGIRVGMGGAAMERVPQRNRRVGTTAKRRGGLLGVEYGSDPGDCRDYRTGPDRARRRGVSLVSRRHLRSRGGPKPNLRNGVGADEGGGRATLGESAYREARTVDGGVISEPT